MKKKNTLDSPKNESGLIQMTRMGKSIRHTWVNSTVTGWRCDTEITITITSSECSRPLSEGVYIWANMNSRVIDSSDGVYTLRVCSLPVTIYIWKYGFRFTRILARHTEETVTLQCTGKNIHKGTTLDGFSDQLLNEPRCEKTGLRGFRPGPTQTVLYSYRRWLEA